MGCRRGSRTPCVDAGGNPRDPWIPYWGQGFPLLRYYQHLPHLAVVLVYRVLRGAVPLYAEWPPE